MKDKKSTTEWREFEKLIALLEAHLGREGAIIKSPDFLLDKITGELREVDASVRYHANSMPFLITIECRDRNSTEDTRWIEQLVTKRVDIGATTTIAVSSKKFSKPARTKAEFYNIETRTLNEISEESIRDWASKLNIILFRGQFRLGALGLRFKLSDENPSPELHPLVKAGYEKGDIEYKFIQRVASDQFISIGDLLREHETKLVGDLNTNVSETSTFTVPPKSSASLLFNSTFPSLFEDVSLDGTLATKLFACDFDDENARIQTTKGFTQVERLEVEIHVAYRAYPANIGRLLSYKNEQGSILNVDERTITLENGKTINMVISGKSDV